MKRFKLKYQTPDGKIDYEMVQALSIEDARDFALALCRVRSVKMLAINTYIEPRKHW